MPTSILGQVGEMSSVVLHEFPTYVGNEIRGSKALGGRKELFCLLCDAKFPQKEGASRRFYPAPLIAWMWGTHPFWHDSSTLVQIAAMSAACCNKADDESEQMAG